VALLVLQGQLVNTVRKECLANLDHQELPAGLETKDQSVQRDNLVLLDLLVYR
jgi:hypothetical protein